MKPQSLAFASAAALVVLFLSCEVQDVKQAEIRPDTAEVDTSAATRFPTLEERWALQKIAADSACRFLEGLPKRWPDLYADNQYYHYDDSCLFALLDSMFVHAFVLNNDAAQKELDTICAAADGCLAEYLWIKFADIVEAEGEHTIRAVLDAYHNGRKDFVYQFLAALAMEQEFDNGDSLAIERAFDRGQRTVAHSADERSLVRRMRNSVFTDTGYAWLFR